MPSADDRPIRLRGFTVEITGVDGTPLDVDSSWETCTGGGLNIDPPDAGPGADPAVASTPGHKYLDEIVLRGPMTDGRKAMMDWINATTKGENPRRNVTIREIMQDGTAGRTFNYFDCFPTQYVFPVLAADGTGNLYEEVHIKPIRLELA